MPMAKYYARVCWNTNEWVFPSGDKKGLEKRSFTGEAGFGHEEWLFNFYWQISGYHYAHLTPVGHSLEKVRGMTIDLVLYTISPKRQRFYVGEITDCEVLNEGEAEMAVNHYKKMGWWQQMKEQIENAQGQTERLDSNGGSLSVFNVRFLPSKITLNRPPRLASSSDYINRLNRYQLVQYQTFNASTGYPKSGPKGTTSPLNADLTTKTGTGPTVVDPVHKALQNEILKLLQAKPELGKAVLEADRVDLTVDAKHRFLVEIKTDPQAHMAVRKALGQILEYAYYSSKTENEAAQLVIIAPAHPDEALNSYIELLRNRFGIPITYCKFSSGDELPAVFS